MISVATRFKIRPVPILQLLSLSCGMLMAGCSSTIQFHEPNQRGATEEAPPTELITEHLINAERASYERLTNQNLEKLLVTRPAPYTIGSGDVISIVVWDHPELASTTVVGTPGDTVGAVNPPQGFVVDSRGRIQFPLLGMVAVNGLTEEEARTLFSIKLSKYLAKPNVTLRVSAYRSKRVYVDGEVKQPGLQAIDDIPMTLLEALNRAGGLLATADQSRIVLERDEARYRINLRELVQRGANLGLVMLAPGDLVRVHTRDESKVFVSGEVITPRALTMHDGRLTLNEALGETGGINPLSGNARQVYVVRKTPERARVFQLDARMAGSLAMAEAFELQPKDIVYVAATPLARWNRNLSLLIPGALTSAVSTTNGQ